MPNNYAKPQESLPIIQHNFTLWTDDKVREAFGEKGCKEEGSFFISKNMFFIPESKGAFKGYKIHVNVSDECVLSFLEEFVPKLEDKGVVFKVWRPSKLNDAEAAGQGKLLTIYAQSRYEALQICDMLEPLIVKYLNDILPQREKTLESPKHPNLTGFVSYRYCTFTKQPLCDSWHAGIRITDDESRNGNKAGWARGLDEIPRIVSRLDVIEGRAKIGDMVLLQRQGQDVPAELLDYDPIRNTVCVLDIHVLGMIVLMNAVPVDKLSESLLRNDP